MEYLVTMTTQVPDGVSDSAVAAMRAREAAHTAAGMPLRVWRTDTVTPLLPHPNDPGFGRVPLDPRCAEYLITFIVDIPAGTASATLTAHPSDPATMATAESGTP